MSVLLLLAVAGWLVAVVSLAGAAWLWRERRAYQRELPEAHALRGELEAAGRREQALSGDHQALQKRLDDAEDTVRYYREATKVKDIHIAWLEGQKGADDAGHTEGTGEPTPAGSDA